MATSPLALLMKAGSPEDVTAFFGRCFRHRHDSSLVNVAQLCKALDVTDAEATKLVQTGIDLVQQVLFSSASISSLQDIAPFLPTTLHRRLAKLIAETLLAALPKWREAAVESRVSLPRLVDVDWRVDVKTSAEAVSRMAVPTLLVDMQVAKQPTKDGKMAGVEHVNFELSKEALSTMIAGLHKIRDQLAGIQ